MELHRLSFNPSAEGSLLLGTGALLPRGGYRVSLTGEYQHQPLVYFENGVRAGAVVKHRMTGALSASFGLSNRLELAAQVPLVMTQTGDDLRRRGIATPPSGLVTGTVSAQARWGLGSERLAEPLDFAAGLTVGLPVGASSTLARNDAWRVTPNVMLGRTLGTLYVGTDLGIAFQSTQTLNSDANVQDEIGPEIRLGGVVSTVGTGPRWELNLLGNVPLTRTSTTMQAFAGARLPLTNILEGFALAGLGFGKAPGIPRYGLVAGLSFGGVRRGNVELEPLLDEEALARQAPPPPPEPPPPPTPAPAPSEDACADGASGAGCIPLLSPLTAVSLGKDRIEVTEGIRFYPGQARLLESSMALLREVAKLLNEHPELTHIWITGHTDNLGTPEANLELSRRRAEAVRVRLIALGIEPGRLDAVGLGDTLPVAPNATVFGRATNRRVEFLTVPPPAP